MQEIAKEHMYYKVYKAYYEVVSYHKVYKAKYKPAHLHMTGFLTAGSKVKLQLLYIEQVIYRDIRVHHFLLFALKHGSKTWSYE